MLNVLYRVYMFVCGLFVYVHFQYDLEPDGKIRFKISFKEDYGGCKGNCA